MTDAPVLTHRNGAVAEITLNRPEALNAMSQALVASLTQVVRDLSAAPQVRAIILTGAGRAFCCGLDLKELATKPGALSAFDWHGSGSLASVIRACPHPIISAVNGFAITGGLELALLGDFLIADPKAQFADTHARVGITPSWGLTQTLPRLIGTNRARQMSLTGEFVDAETACNWGLVNEVTPEGQLMDRARALAVQISETDRSTMGKIRGLIGLSDQISLEDALTREAEVFDAHIAQVSPTVVGENRKVVTARGRAVAGQSAIGERDQK
jgi:enoyl-CoA hydratase